ncbi:MAG: bifunctional diguanylate cyclase/phosphodiesterase [Betaproteobacteria bacterium]|nr:MAG: bifunctional diguanylate cyclase/phosphodiesterase [Betaproteobacteria bacterium]
MPSHSISFEELKQLANSVPAMLACYESSTLTCLYANDAYAQLSSRRTDELIGKNYALHVGQREASAIRGYIDEVLATGKPAHYERTYVDANQLLRFLEVSLLPNRDADPDRLFVLISDITQHRSAEIAAQDSADRTRKFFEASEEGILFHTNGLITDVNPSLLRMTGCSESEVIGRQTIEFVPSALRPEVLRVIASGVETSYESVITRKDGSELNVEYIIRNLALKKNSQRMVIVRDLTARKDAEARIRFLAFNDSLTGLPNRGQVDERFAVFIEQSAAHQWSFATLFLDLDQVKRVNDSLGHHAGDALLCEVAARLAGVCKGDQITHRYGEAWLARLGGDEFVIALHYVERSELDAFVSVLMALFNEPVRIEARELRVSASVGVAIYPQDGQTATQLLKNADAAMYFAKNQGRATVRYFDASLALAADFALETEQELSAAMTQQQFELHFQPQLSLDGTRLFGVEALIRWNHPTRGLVSPEYFIRVAEDVHLILPIGQWVMDQALLQVKLWQAAGWREARVAVNLSSNQFRDGDFVQNVVSALERANVSGHCLELELTERMVMGEQSQVLAVLRQLKALGITLSIDDFGTGFSSLSRLRSLPIDLLKIDQSFIEDIPESHSALAVVTSLIQLAKGLSIQVVAEGVETEAQRECLDLLGCSIAQGYLSARPMPADEFLQWLSAFLNRSLGRG